jgi:hypothetical protein
MRYPDDHDYMNLQYGVKRSIARPTHTLYWFALVSFLYKMDFDYVSKMTYNKDKDLVFVTRPSRLWGETETIYEVHHLEQMVPSAVSAIPYIAENNRNGILTVKCMAQNENLKFYSDEKYWNADLKKEFIHETSGLWEGSHSDKYNGRIFQTRGELSRDMLLAVHKVDKEMEAAVQKHGVVTHPGSLHVDEFYERIEQNKSSIARA